ncbi:MAG: hypothetical protein AAFV93_06300 [Chloroflexota bacterium]
MMTHLALYASVSYRIVVCGTLSTSWYECFDNMHLTQDEQNGCTVLTGIVRDQVQLISILRKLNNMAMPIVSVQCLSLG